MKNNADSKTQKATMNDPKISSFQIFILGFLTLRMTITVEIRMNKFSWHWTLHWKYLGFWQVVQFGPGALQESWHLWISGIFCFENHDCGSMQISLFLTFESLQNSLLCSSSKSLLYWWNVIFWGIIWSDLSSQDCVYQDLAVPLSNENHGYTHLWTPPVHLWPYVYTLPSSWYAEHGRFDQKV